MSQSHPEAENAAAYVLGALTELERHAFERHLAGCAECRHEVERLQPAVDALADRIPPLDPPPDLLDDVVRGLEPHLPADAGPARPAQLKPRRTPAAATAASILLVIGGIAGYGVAHLGDDDPPRSLAATVDESRLPGAGATLIAPEDPDDPAALRMEGLRQLPTGRAYQLWLERDGEIVSVALFRPAKDGTAVTAIPSGLRDVGAVLVTREAANGAKTPSEEPVVSVKV